MKNDFSRTGKTHLEDNELILFDAIFDSSCSIEQLRSEGFNERFNFAYKHFLNNKDLISLLIGLESQNLIKIKDSATKNIAAKNVSLTAKGGKLWEQEREPIWEKYCEDHLYLPLKIKNKMFLEIVSPSERTLKTYLDAIKKVKFYGFSKKHEITFFTKKRKFIVGLNWKRFEELHFVIVKVVYDENPLTDWNKYYDL